MKHLDNEVIALLWGKKIETMSKMNREKTINIFLLPNKKQRDIKIFRREAFAKYLNMRVDFIKKY